MKSQKPQNEELRDLQESLELQRRQALALILELQDDCAGPEETEKPRLKLALINQELAQCTVHMKNLKRREAMGFETPEKIQAIGKVLQQAVSSDLKAAVRARDEAEVKLQVMVARKAKFESQRGDLAAEIGALKAKISQVLGEGGDPSDLNRQSRAKGLEIEDLESWIAQLQNSAIPETEKLLSEGQITVWKALLGVASKVKTNFAEEMKNHLLQAAEIRHSWGLAAQNFFKEYRTGREPTPNTLEMVLADKKMAFFA